MDSKLAEKDRSAHVAVDSDSSVNAHLNTPSSKISDDALLAELGYRQVFKREFTPLEVFGVAFSIIGLLPSMASVLFNAVPNGGPAAMVWGWAIAVVFILIIGLALAELASAAPTSGGLYYWTYSLCSPRYRTLASWLVGYSNTVGQITGFASISWGCAVQIMAAASIGSSSVNAEGETTFGFVATNAQTYGVFAFIVCSSALVCSGATRLLARVQTIYIVLNVILCLAVIIALPAATPSHLRNDARYALGFGGFTNLSDWPNGFAFILSFVYPLWTICAFDSVVHISEEAANAATAVPWAIIASILVAGVLGFGINVALAFCMGTDIEGIVSSPIGQPMATIFFNSFGKKGTLAIWIVVVVVQYTMGTSAVLSASRQTFAFARDGALPLSSFLNLATIHPRTQTPIRTVWFCAAGALLIGCLAFVGSPQAIGAVFGMSVAALYFAYAIPIGARVVGRVGWRRGYLGGKGEGESEKGGGEDDGVNARVWGIGPFYLGVFSMPIFITAFLFLTTMVVVFLFPVSPGPTAQDANYTALVLGGVLLLSVGWYYFPKWGGMYWFEGPVRTVDGSESGDA